MRVIVLRRSHPALLFVLFAVSILPAKGQDQRPLTHSKEKEFTSHCTSPAMYQRWLNEDALWIITKQERMDFERLTTDEQRDEFIEKFWGRRNPTSGPENPYKEQHYRRIAYANIHFAAGIPGFRTDRGRIYIVYGPPDEIEEHAGSPGMYAHQLWRYKYMKGIGRDVSVEFVDTCQCGDYHLTTDWSEKIGPVHED